MPKKIKNMTIPELAFALTQHADDLQLFANGVSMDAAGDFEQTEAAIMELIYQLYDRYGESGLPMNAATKRYLENLKAKIADIRASVFDEDGEELLKQNREVVKNESKFLKAFYFALTGIEAAALTPEWYSRISKYGIYNGGTVGQIFDKLSQGDANRIYDAMIDAIRSGKDLNAARETVRNELARTRRFVKSEIDSIVNGAANDAALAFAAENHTKLLYSAVLDDRVCEDCAGRDGTVYDCDDPDIPSLPRHFHCRCSLIPVSSGNDENKGLSMPFPDYVRMLPKAEQKARLGPAKYDLWKSGQYRMKAYEAPNPDQRLSMAEFKARDKALFAIDSSKLPPLPE